MIGMHRIVRRIQAAALGRMDPHGGLVPPSLERAKKVDLITLPIELVGTNCGNCKHFEGLRGAPGFCNHKDVRMHVTNRQCCVKWDAEGTYRPWEKKHDTP
jgi:hypothetical protein